MSETAITSYPFHEWLVNGPRVYRADIAFTQIDILAKGEERVLILTRNGAPVETITLSNSAAAHLSVLLAPTPSGTKTRTGS